MLLNGIFCLFLGTQGVMFPSDPALSVWTASPALQPFHESRATGSSILLAWSTGKHSMEAIGHYEVRVRWPLAVEQYDYKLQARPTERDFFALDRVTNREWAKQWSEYTSVYSGLGRQWNFSTPLSLNGTVRVFDFQVRAVSVTGLVSEWSEPVLMHTVLENRLERFSVELVGTGRNNAMRSLITVGGTAIVNKTDLRGFALAVFDRSNFSLAHVDVYDVFTNRSESARMVADIQKQGPDKFIAVVSGDAWEWNLTPQLASVLEVYGAYYVGQWARVFSNSIRPWEYADLAETASQDTFGHPYALLGQWGLGTGGGLESIQLNTGHYLTTGKAQRAIVRVQVYYNYMLGRYFIGNRETRSSDFFTKAQVPRPGTVHNPISQDHTVVPAYQVQPQLPYAPYIGNLHKSLEYLMEANETVVWDEYNSTNYGFEIVQVLEKLPDPLISNDPRVGSALETELERIWGGPTKRYSGVLTGQTLPGTVQTGTVRICPTILSKRLTNDIHSVCSDYDSPSLAGSASLIRFGQGMFPTLCHASEDPNCTSQPSPGTFSKIFRADPWVSGTLIPDYWLP